MSFAQAMVVPTLVSVGLGALLVARHMPVSEALYAQAPAAAEGQASAGNGPLGAPARARGVAAAAGANAAATNAVGGPAMAGAAAAGAARGRGDGPASGPGSLGTNSPEFGGRGPDGSVIRAITEAELGLKAVEQSGREDPFMALLPPDPGSIIPPQVDFGPLAAPPAPIAPPTVAPTVPSPPPVVAPPRPIAVTPTVTPKPEDRPFGGDRPPQVGEPQWLIRGIISTGLERVALLEGKEEQLTARVGDVLSDGSRIEAVSNRGVTFIRQGRRFVKVIGG